MIKNTANQIFIVFAFNKNTGDPILGDANNIIANIVIDSVLSALNDLHPIEIERGYYYFELTQGETNGDSILISPVSSTEDVIVIGCPGVIFTEPTDRKYPASLNSSDVTGNLPSQIKAKDNLDFTDLEKASLDSKLEPIISDIALIPTLGKGSTEVTYTLTEIDLTPIADANIRVTSDILGLYMIAEGRTNSLGKITFQLDAGSTVYLWRSKTGLVFVNPDVEEVPV